MRRNEGLVREVGRMKEDKQEKEMMKEKEKEGKGKGKMEEEMKNWEKCDREVLGL